MGRWRPLFLALIPYSSTSPCPPGALGQPSDSEGGGTWRGDPHGEWLGLDTTSGGWSALGHHLPHRCPQVLRQFRLMSPPNATCQGLGLEVSITGPIIYQGEATPTLAPPTEATPPLAPPPPCKTWPFK